MAVENGDGDIDMTGTARVIFARRARQIERPATNSRSV
jgi:hypothetical protein